MSKRRPSFDDASWDNTFWSLWGALYPSKWANSERELQNSITNLHRDCRIQYSQLDDHDPPLSRRIDEWADVIDRWATTITFGQSERALAELEQCLRDIGQQLAIDRKAIAKRQKASHKRRLKAFERRTAKEEEEEAERQRALAKAAESDHGPSTARVRVRKVKPVPVVRSAAEIAAEDWLWKQRQMATQCDNCIGYGMHAVTQDSVLDKLELDEGDGGVTQSRATSANDEIRALRTRKGVIYWVVGVTHHESRVAGKYSVYRRIGNKERFVYVSGRRLAADPNT